MKRSQAIDILRGLACLAVLFAHISHGPGPDHAGMHTVLFLPVDFGYLGVPLFLLISGFCIHSGPARYMVAGHHSLIEWSAFWRRRFWRLYPPYIAAIGLSLVTYYLVAGDNLPTIRKIVNLPWDTATHLLMIHNLFADYCPGLGNGPFWTLGLEEQLYAFYALYLLLRKRLPPARVLLIASCVSLIWRLFIPFVLGHRIGTAPFEFGAWQHWPFGYWGFWVAGALAAEANVGAITLPAWCYHRHVMWCCFAAGVLTSQMSLGRIMGFNWAPAVLPGIAVKLAQHLIWLCDPAFFAAGCFILIGIWTRQERLGDFGFSGAGLLARVGVVSYSLYLTHTPVLRILEWALPIRNSIAGTLTRYAIYTPICLVSALVFFWTIERHFLKPPQRRDANQAEEIQMTQAEPQHTRSAVAAVAVHSQGLVSDRQHK